MNYFLSIVVTAVCFLVLCGTYWIWAVNRTHRQGKVPQRTPTMFDVRRLLQEGDRETAIRMYVQIFKVPLKQARRDVEELERNLKV
jgi:hypothetical protein